MRGTIPASEGGEAVPKHGFPNYSQLWEGLFLGFGGSLVIRETPHFSVAERRGGRGKHSSSSELSQAMKKTQGIEKTTMAP